jgi:polyvinyl alcohol dehydrogenase (cytochrome)
MAKRSCALACTFAAVVLAAACGGGGKSGTSRGRAARSLECAWPMFGRDAARSFAYPSRCSTPLAPDSVSRLRQKWFRPTSDVVTATPAIADDSAFVGDWSGKFYALSLADGSIRWTFTAPPHKNVYSGQIVSSAAVAEVDRERRVFFGSGKTLYALRANDGRLRWKHVLNPGGGADDLTEIQSSPVIARGMVIFGYDGHDTVGTRAGMVALDTRTGSERWNFDSDRGGPATGCGGVWSSPAVDTELKLVIAGTANCPSAPKGWNAYSEAVFAVDLGTGAPKWTFQPRGPSNNDFDFAGAPNLFDANGRALVGLGGKDGVYYALDRATGKVVWKTTASTPRPQSPNFSTGGFIGATAVDDGLVFGGTAIGGPCPCLHGIRTKTGAIAWQQRDAGPTFAPSAIVNGVAFSGSTTDFTLRAMNLRSGKVLWSHQLAGGIAGGVAVTGGLVVAVAGIREPGIEAAGTDSGVYGFALGPAGATTTTAAPQGTLPPTTAAPPPTAADPNAPSGPRCIGRPCTVSFTLKTRPGGTNPSMTIHLRPQPFRIEVRADDLGDPNAWLRTGSSTADKGAVTYAVFASDDALKGSLLCVLDANFDCVNEVAPSNPRPSYNRISVLAIANTPELPAVSEGFDRLVTTVALEHPVSFE